MQLIPITKRETGGGQKFGYYAAILSGKNDHGLQSLSTAEHFASSFFFTSAGGDFYIYTQNAQGLNRT